MRINKNIGPKTCPRCQGYLHANSDIYGGYTECLQCGYMIDTVKADDGSTIPYVPMRRDAA